jgi:hypothetical protein
MGTPPFFSSANIDLPIFSMSMIACSLLTLENMLSMRIVEALSRNRFSSQSGCGTRGTTTAQGRAVSGKVHHYHNEQRFFTWILYFLKKGRNCYNLLNGRGKTFSAGKETLRNTI